MEVKSALKSKAVWGGIIAIIPALADAANQIGAMPIIPGKVAVVMSAIGGVLAIIGRFTAKLPIKFP